MRNFRNILFIMCDQLRWDYLSCYGHPKLHTPNIDALAARGVRFTRAYVQSPVCGASRMSFYTGRYVQSHGASWNGVPLKVGEMTLGDYLRPLGLRTALVGKTHMKADKEGMERLGIDPDSIIGVRVAECGFDPYERDDGLHAIGPDGRYDPQLPRYNDYLTEKGYTGDNPWHDWANAAPGDGNQVASGWAMRNARKPARVDEEDSETPYMTRRAMDFMREAGGEPWCLHLSYIKPHWPYIAPAPYNDMYEPSDVPPVVRSEAERVDPHPVFREFMQQRVSQTFARDEVREEVIPVYMGLIKQIDDQLGVLFRFMKERGLLDDTMIVFTSDHGDYLGDHWMGEKDLFHEPSVKVPLIICDPSREADATRGTVCDELVEVDRPGADFPRRSRQRSGSPIAPARGPLAPAVPAWSRADNVANARDQRVRLFDPSRGHQARHRTARRPPVHGRRQALEVRPCGRFPAHALRHGERSGRVSRSRRRSRIRSRTGAPFRRARHLGSASFAAHDVVGISKSATGAASRSARAS